MPSTLFRRPKKIFAAVALFDFTASPWIRILMALRGIPGRFLKTNGLARYKFLELERRENDEIIIGLIGKFRTPSGSLQDFEPSAFGDFNTPGFAKATWNFKLTPTAHATTLSTETRIFCTDENARRKFKRYWFFVKPFSLLIRMEMLRALKKRAESFQDLP